MTNDEKSVLTSISLLYRDKYPTDTLSIWAYLERYYLIPEDQIGYKLPILLARLVEKGYIYPKKGRIYLTNKGLQFGDYPDSVYIKDAIELVRKEELY